MPDTIEETILETTEHYILVRKRNLRNGLTAYRILSRPSSTSPVTWPPDAYLESKESGRIRLLAPFDKYPHSLALEQWSELIEYMDDIRTELDTMGALVKEDFRTRPATPTPASENI